LTQHDRFLAVRAPDLPHHPGQFRVGPRVVEELEQARERLPRRLHLMRGVQDALTERDHAVQLADL
jgi:hypothetical protein